MRLLSALVLITFTVSGFGQTRTFKWTDELCEYAGTYDAKKYTLNQLRNTYRLLSHSDLQLSPVGATVWKYEDITKIDVAALDARYKDLIDELEHLEYVSTPFTDSVRAARLVETRQLYQLARTTMAAYTDPAVIRKYKGADACKLNFGEPIIAGGDSLIAAWRKTNLDSQSKNAAPQLLQKRWDEQNASPDRLKFALVETMSFGWWNCANNELKYAEAINGARYYKEFRKLFVRVRTVRCDEP